jgi:hypothetical protein
MDSGRDAVRNGDAVADIPGPDGARGVLLVEGKSHEAELSSPKTEARGESLETIRRALDETKGHLGVPEEVEWTGRYYQLANRLAFLYYLRVRRSLPAWLLSIYFLGDRFESGGREIVGPTDPEGWREPMKVAEEYLSLPSDHPLSEYASRLYLPADHADDLIATRPGPS